MKKYTDEDILKAKTLRLTTRYSFNQLQKITGIPATTLKNWCKNQLILTKSDALLLANDRKRTELKKSEISSLDHLMNIDVHTAKLLASLLYWCEGSKYPSSNALVFVNSDPNLVKTFITLLRKGFILNESKISVRLQIHTDHDYEKLRKFWSKFLVVSPQQFTKPTITSPKNGKHRPIYQGTCTLKYQDFRIQLKLIGIYEAFALAMN